MRSSLWFSLECGAKQIVGGLPGWSSQCSQSSKASARSEKAETAGSLSTGVPDRQSAEPLAVLGTPTRPAPLDVGSTPSLLAGTGIHTGPSGGRPKSPPGRSAEDVPVAVAMMRPPAARSGAGSRRHILCSSARAPAAAAGGPGVVQEEAPGPEVHQCPVVRHDLQSLGLDCQLLHVQLAHVADGQAYLGPLKCGLHWRKSSTRPWPAG